MIQTLGIVTCVCSTLNRGRSRKSKTGETINNDIHMTLAIIIHNIIRIFGGRRARGIIPQAANISEF